ncbi:MAG: histidine--tRNA ligase [Candidatus Pacebacteria bacterium]|nr:histidine--tRNA ligase [Candidatus Paceibacterota bacterium]
MADNYLSTDPYKGVRDFYPEDMAVQRYIFDVWAATAESFGFERYDASVLEPAILYKSKGAENEEMVNEQTYTFIDRGEREVTLRPEMTPTVARMVAGRRRGLSLPVRWYSIPNLFRYERPQRGRLREHWQLNCDIFGADDYTADVEIIALAHQIIMNFGAEASLFAIHINDRAEMREKYREYGIENIEKQDAITRLNDRFHKISADEYKTALKEIVGDDVIVEAVYTLVSGGDSTDSNKVVDGLRELGIRNVKIDRSIARGFNYYTGTIFEIFDVSGENNRSMLGGGRYDNLTSMFSADPISGIGFGMGDVTMRDFLETHNLLTSSITAPTVMVIPMEANQNLAAQKIAMEIRRKEISVATDIGTRKLGKKISDAAERLVEYIIVVGEDELASGTYTLKNLIEETEMKGTIDELITHITEAE